VVLVIIVDKAVEARVLEGRPILTGLFGAGFMARGIVNQGRYVKGVKVAAVCNRTVEAAVEMCKASGVDDVEVVDSAAAADEVIARGGTAVTADPAVLCGSELLECLVEATGHVEYGAKVTNMAIEGGKHMVLMNAELDGTVGPLLAKRAEAAGVILTGCDGDQPGVEINLYRFVESLGLTPRVCGNIKGLQDRYRNPTTQEGFAKQWGQTPSMVTSFADGTKISFEQAIVANATGMKVAQRGMIGIEHAGHVDELTGAYDLDMLREVGGIVEYVVGSAPSPGVYVFAEAHDDVQAHYLNYGKLGTGPLYSFYVPYHLTIFEVPLTVARVVEFGDAAIRPLGGPVVDVITCAKVDLKAGQVLDGLGEYLTYGMCENHDVVRREGLVPMGLAEGSVLTRDIPKDGFLTVDDVEYPTDTLVHQLRAEQDALFAPQEVPA
jgi:predicted homoserine dehydrogenase-like protein